MKQLLIALALVLTIANNAQAFLGAYSASDNKKSASKTYSEVELKKLLSSQSVACFSYERKAYLSKGYIAKFGNTKEFCSAKAAKAYNVTRLNKNDLTLDARLKLMGR